MGHFYWWCKHFHLVYLFISIFLHGSFALHSSPPDFIEDEPTEEPEEYILTKSESSANNEETISVSTVSYLNENVTTSADKSTDSVVESLNKENEYRADDRQYQNLARAFPYTSGSMWQIASKFAHKGLRMFRESLLEGAKVAHMFKEDMDEGVDNIMRQNRGIKKLEGQPDVEKHDSGFFESQMLREGVLGGILRFMGVNSKQMGVIALNVLIILAEWITSSMIGNNDAAGVTSRMIKNDLLQWSSTGHNVKIEKLLTQAKSHTLPEKLINKLDEKTGNSTSCVQLLICKISPVIWGFQDTMTDQMKAYGISEDMPWRTAPRDHSNNSSSDAGKDEPKSRDEKNGIFDNFFSHLPPIEKLVDFSNRCETKFPHCKLINVG